MGGVFSTPEEEEPTQRRQISNNNNSEDDAADEDIDPAHLPNNSILNPRRYTHIQRQCFCRGNYWKSTAAREHMVLVAFLKYKNAEFDQPTCGSGTLFPVNWLATQLGNTEIIHCQLVFIDDEREEYYTFSTDFEHNTHVVSRKTFAKTGWRWVIVMCSEEQELAMHNFCVAQLYKPFSRAGIIGLYLVPTDTNGESWFCSQFVLAALRAGGLACGWQWPAHTVKPHELYEYITETYADTTTIVLDDNVNPALNAHQRRTERKSRK